MGGERMSWQALLLAAVHETPGDRPGLSGSAARHVQRPGHRDHRPAGIRGPAGRTAVAAGRAARAPDDLAAPASVRSGGRRGGDHARDLARRGRSSWAGRRWPRPCGRTGATSVRCCSPWAPSWGGCTAGSGRGSRRWPWRRRARSSAARWCTRRTSAGTTWTCPCCGPVLRIRPGPVRRGQRRHLRRGGRSAARRGGRGGGGAAPVPGRRRRRGDAQRGARRAGGARDGRGVRPHAVR